MQRIIFLITLICALNFMGNAIGGDGKVAVVFDEDGAVTDICVRKNIGSNVQIQELSVTFPAGTTTINNLTECKKATRIDSFAWGQIAISSKLGRIFKVNYTPLQEDQPPKPTCVLDPVSGTLWCW